MTKWITLCCIFILVFVSASYRKAMMQVKEETIAGIPVKIISEYRTSFKTQFVTLAIPEELYSRDNLENIWRHYCEKYPDKRDKLDVRIYTNRSYEFNHQFKGQPVDMHTGEVLSRNKTRVKLREYEAMFFRMGDGALAFGGDNELMVYSPDLDMPEKKERVILAGKDPFDQYAYTGNKDSDFVAAVAKGDIAKFKSLLAEGISVDARDRFQSTALIRASGRGYIDIVKLLLGKGAYVNAKDEGGWTALIVAASNGHNEIIQLLLERGADLNAKNDMGMSALARTIYDGETETFKLLSAKGADIESKDQRGNTPLIQAVSGNPEVVRLLLKGGADVNVRNNEGETPLMRAHSEENIMALLNKGADINAQDKAGYTSLMYAITNHNPEKVKILLDHGTDVSIKTKKGETALQIAKQYTGNAKVIKMLIEAGAK